MHSEVDRGVTAEHAPGLIGLTRTTHFTNLMGARPSPVQARCEEPQLLTYRSEERRVLFHHSSMVTPDT